MKLPTIEEAYQGEHTFVPSRTIFATLHGSHAYGLANESSDVDIKGVCLGPKSFYLGLGDTFEQAEAHTPYDIVVYELQKFMRLAANCNPNIIEVLFTDPECFVKVTPLGEKLLDHKQDFLSLRAKHTFAGYAHSQLQRLQGHYRWLSNPPLAAPTREEFGLLPHTVIPADQLGVVQAEIQKKLDSFGFDWNVVEEAERLHLKKCLSSFLAEMQLTSDDLWIRTGRSIGMDENFLELLKAERKYKSKLDDWRSYQHWLATRNAKRSALEAKFGYDTKHASHLVRLMKMCREIITTGKVNVKRVEDREEILAIKTHGIWSYEKLISWADEQEKDLNLLYHEAVKNPAKILPEKPDMKKLDQLCLEILEQGL